MSALNCIFCHDQPGGCAECFGFEKEIAMHPNLTWFCGNCGLPRKADSPHVCLDSDELFRAAQTLIEHTPRCHAHGCKKLSTKHASWFWCDAHAPDSAVEQPGAAVVRVLEPVLACQWP